MLGNITSTIVEVVTGAEEGGRECVITGVCAGMF